MELLIGFGILGVLAVLALLFGHDSRDGYSTKERDLAALGMRWEAGRVDTADETLTNDEERPVTRDLAKELGSMVPAGHDGWPPELAPLVGPGSKG